MKSYRNTDTEKNGLYKLDEKEKCYDTELQNNK